MAELHFVKSYERHVQHLIETTHPLSAAMELAVGGEYDSIGLIEADLLAACGLKAGHSVVDIGCGSGRLATRLGERFGSEIKYLGADVVQSLLDYAATKSPPSYRFVLHREIGLPAADVSVDFVTAFSVFTHLYHEETYTYLRDAKRVLVPGGAIVFSFLEAAKHWAVFEPLLKPNWLAERPLLVMFIERPAIDHWAARLEMKVEYDVGPSLGQSVALLRKPHR